MGFLKEMRLRKNIFKIIDHVLTICYDIKVNKHSTGTRYDSLSGHGIMVGTVSKEVIG